MSLFLRNYLKMPCMEELDKGGAGNSDENLEKNLDEKPDEAPDKKTDEEPTKRSVPEATFLEEKKRRKELEHQLREFKEKDVEKDSLLTKTQLKQKYIDKGFDEELADSLAEEFAAMKSEVRKASFKELDNSAIDDDLKELARDSFFSDAPTYKNEIQALVKDYKAKGIELDVEEAYFKIRGKSRMREYRTDIEQKALLDRRKGEEKKLPNSNPAPTKDPYPLDDTDKKALEGLQKAQPSAGWTAEKFYKLMKG